MRIITVALNQNMGGNCLNEVFASAGDEGCVKDTASCAPHVCLERFSQFVTLQSIKDNW